MNAITLPPPRNGRLMLALVAGLLALPFVIAAGLYFGGWKPTRSIEHGHLITPPQPLPATGLFRPDGQAVPSVELQGKWLLVMHLDGPCAEACANRIDEMRRIQVSLYKEMGRLHRVVLAPQPGAPELAAARVRQPDLLVLGAPSGWLDAESDNAPYRLHIVDPMGRRVIDYPPEVDAKALRTDLERLLKFAWTG